MSRRGLTDLQRDAIAYVLKNPACNTGEVAGYIGRSWGQTNAMLYRLVDLGYMGRQLPGFRFGSLRASWLATDAGAAAVPLEQLRA